MTTTPLSCFECRRFFERIQHRLRQATTSTSARALIVLLRNIASPLLVQVLASRLHALVRCRLAATAAADAVVALIAAVVVVVAW